MDRIEALTAIFEELSKTVQNLAAEHGKGAAFEALCVYIGSWCGANDNPEDILKTAEAFMRGSFEAAVAGKHQPDAFELIRKAGWGRFSQDQKAPPSGL